MQRARRIEETIFFTKGCGVDSISRMDSIEQELNKRQTKYIASHIRLNRPTYPIIEKDEITEQQYMGYLSRREESMRMLRRNHFKLLHGDYHCLLINYGLIYTGLSTLQVPVSTYFDEAVLPPYLEGITDITDDKRFSERCLANSETDPEKLLASITAE